MQLDPSDHATRLAFERTRIAQERTLLAWVRTAITLITFGFTIYSVFAIESGAGHALAQFFAPRLFSLALIVLGLVCLVFASIEQRRAQATLRLIHPGLPAHSLAWVLAAIVACLGISALALLLYRNLT